jgi:hypothetical protein
MKKQRFQKKIDAKYYIAMGLLSDEPGIQMVSVSKAEHMVSLSYFLSNNCY